MEQENKTFRREFAEKRSYAQVLRQPSSPAIEPISSPVQPVAPIISISDIGNRIDQLEQDKTFRRDFAEKRSYYPIISISDIGNRIDQLEQDSLCDYIKLEGEICSKVIENHLRNPTKTPEQLRRV